MCYNLFMDESFKPQVENKEKLTKRILFADDMDMVREMCIDLLTSEGYLVDAVENGQLLLDKLNEAKEKYDLVLTDNNMGMPELKGIDVLRKIRGDERFKDLPVIVSSGDDVEKKVKELGGVYVSKGSGNRNLLENIKNLINPQKQP